MLSDTIVALGTPSGESALAVIRVSGPLAGALAAELTDNRVVKPRRVWHGNYVSLDGTIIDDVVGCFFKCPHSYSGEDTLEISSHGSPFIVRKIVEDCVSRGCRLAEPGEFTRRAFLNGRLDLTEAEAVMDIIRARSDRALEQAQRQLRGALGRRVNALADRVLGICASIEAYIDFPEDDLPAEDREARRREILDACGEIERLRATRRQGEMLRDGLKVVLLGDPNAGKSSLLNRLAGYDRAIVSAEPGTTRDFLEEPIAVGPHRARIFDTAGLREAASGIERSGVERALELAETADIFVLVVDSTRPSPPLPAAIASRVTAANALVASNKCDLPRFAGATATAMKRLIEVRVSALTGEGLDVLRTALIAMADALTHSGGDEEFLAVNARHAEALEASVFSMTNAARLLAESGPLELVSSELRGCVDALGRIVGRLDNEMILDRLFASFCIGK